MPPKKNALSTVVDDLIRASLGKTGSSIETEDLDKYVADLILKEAEEKRKKYNDIGVRAYQPDTGLPPNNLPKPNKRFLLNMVKATDSHNKHVIRSNEEKVAKLRQERLDRERKERDHLRRERSRRDGRHSRTTTTRLKSRSRSSSPERKSNSSSNRSHKRPPPSNVDSPKEEDVQYRGRGKVKMSGSSMDKYFEKDYDPERDIESDLDEYVLTEALDRPIKKEETEKKKKDKKDRRDKKNKKDRKDKKKKHKSKRKHRESSSSEDEEDEKDRKKQKIVRAWDVGK